MWSTMYYKILRWDKGYGSMTIETTSFETTFFWDLFIWDHIHLRPHSFETTCIGDHIHFRSHSFYAMLKWSCFDLAYCASIFYDLPFILCWWHEVLQGLQPSMSQPWTRKGVTLQNFIWIVTLQNFRSSAKKWKVDHKNLIRIKSKQLHFNAT